MQIEAGKYYRTRDGRKVGPMVVRWPEDRQGDIWGVKGSGEMWNATSGAKWNHSRTINDGDLIAEWVDEPAATPEVGTLRELNVKPGDVVECVGGSRMVEYYTGVMWRCLDSHPKGYTDEPCVYYEKGSENGYLPADNDTWQFRIISRATPALPHGHARLPSGAVVDLTAITTPFGLLDADTQEALRAHGGPIEFYSGTLGWVFVDVAGGWSRNVYRVKPQPPAPVVKTVILTGGFQVDWGVDAWLFNEQEAISDTHRITFDLIDGKPDCASIRMVSL